MDSIWSVIDMVISKQNAGSVSVQNGRVKFYMDMKWIRQTIVVEKAQSVGQKELQCSLGSRIYNLGD